ncbi:MAG: phosphatidate cytidylyltransferase [Firmicutes bacterium]|nr:phosphatidate cytidylyltransferase [Bacillota bacterium]
MMLWQRIGSALIAAPLVLWAVYAGGWPYIVLLTAMSFIAWHELQAMLPASDRLVRRLGYILLIMLIYIGWRWPQGVLLASTMSILVLLATLLWRYERERWQTVTHAITSFCYLGFPILHLIKLGNLPSGWRWIVLLLATVWSYDSFAFFTGCSLGKRRPWPHISPNKSIEGVMGGLLGSMLIATVAFRLLFPHLELEQLLVYGLPFGLGVGIFAQAGDLFESALKRSFAIKDSGRFLPGHGGLLDRVDSVLFATPFVYYFLEMFML